MLLSVENSLDKQPSTLFSFFAANGAAGLGTIPVKNINGFQAQWAIQLGKTGQEQAEIVTIANTPSGTVLTNTPVTRFAHPLDTPIYQIHYDKVIFLRSTAGTAGTATPLATVSITPDSFYTEYNDTSGVASYAYQVQYYNSVSGDLSGTSAWFSPSGPTFFSLQKIRERVKSNLFDSNYIRDDSTVDGWINEFVEVMTNSALKVNQGYSLGTVATGFGTAGMGTITDPLFKYASKVEITTDGINYRNSREIAINKFSAIDVFSSNAPRHYWQGNTVFGVLPAGNAGTARFTLGELSTQLISDTDELPQFLKGYTTACLEYCLYRAKSLDQKDPAGDSHYDKFLTYQNAFVSDITPRDQTGVKFIDFDEGLSGSDDDALLSMF